MENSAPSKFDIVVLLDKFGVQLTQMPLCEIIKEDIKEISLTHVTLVGDKSDLHYSRRAFVELIQSKFENLKFDSIEIIFKENQTKIKIP